jgi:hypothetical protein
MADPRVGYWQKRSGNGGKQSYHVSVSDLYFPTIGSPIFLLQNRQCPISRRPYLVRVLRDVRTVSLN